jgi:Dyp-type peroxidase family
MQSNEPLPEWRDMQGLVLSGYPALPDAAYLLCRITDAGLAQAWLRSILPDVTRALRTPYAEPPQNLNVAFSHAGLTKLGVDMGSDGAGFPRPFVEGIDGDERRRRILGDVGASAPASWVWGGSRKRVDVLLLAFARAQDVLTSALGRWWPARGLECLHRIDATSLCDMGNREHFGFADGVSQPILTGSRDSERFPESKHLTQLGEIVLGYPNADGVTPMVPSLTSCPGFGRNGSYLVARQLQQHVEAFDDFVERQAGPDPLVQEHLAAKIIGRERDGTPLVPYTNRDDNEFGFAEDPYGYGCPLGAHIRRANPRDTFVNTNAAAQPALVANRHRVVRRGRAYGRPRWMPGPADERGLLFLCLNGDIERQFEFIQGDWINNAGFAGLSDERDPLVGYHSGRRAFTMQALPAPATVTGLQPFVTVRGGEYFFLPGLRALHHLAGAHGGGADA